MPCRQVDPSEAASPRFWIVSCRSSGHSWKMTRQWCQWCQWCLVFRIDSPTRQPPQDDIVLLDFLDHGQLLTCELEDTETPSTLQGPSKGRGCTDLSKAALGFSWFFHLGRHLEAKGTMNQLKQYIQKHAMSTNFHHILISLYWNLPPPHSTNLNFPGSS